MVNIIRSAKCNGFVRIKRLRLTYKIRSHNRRELYWNNRADIVTHFEHLCATYNTLQTIFHYILWRHNGSLPFQQLDRWEV
jgi:hypothetical protein